MLIDQRVEPDWEDKMVKELNNPFQKHRFPVFCQSRIIRSFLGKFESKTEIENKLKMKKLNLHFVFLFTQNAHNYFI